MEDVEEIQRRTFEIVKGAWFIFITWQKTNNSLHSKYLYTFFIDIVCVEVYISVQRPVSPCIDSGLPSSNWRCGHPKRSLTSYVGYGSQLSFHVLFSGELHLNNSTKVWFTSQTFVWRSELLLLRCTLCNPKTYRSMIISKQPRS